MSPIPRLKAYSGPALLSYGFRPFFLVSAIYAGLGVLIWLPLFVGELTLPTTFSPLDWHIHEMLYGYLPGVITGFLLTAIPNWTGRLPLQGGPLAVLVAAWIIGRIAVCTSAIIGPLAAGAVDVLFMLLVAAAASREVIVGRNWRNLPPIFIVLIFLAGNVVFHIEDYATGTAELGTRLGIAAAVALISLIGGRVIPSFTRNWLARENPGRLPEPFGRFDMAVLGISLLALGVWVARPAWLGTAALMLITGAAQATRLATLGRRPNVARSARPHSSHRIRLHPDRFCRPRGRRYLSRGGAGERWNPCVDGGSNRHDDAVHHDACQSRPYRPVPDCRAADAKHLRRGCDRGHPSHRGNTTAHRNDSASICRRRRLDRGVLDVCCWLWSAAVAKPENRASIVRHCPALSRAVHPAQLTFENLL